MYILGSPIIRKVKLMKENICSFWQEEKDIIQHFFLILIVSSLHHKTTLSVDSTMHITLYRLGNVETLPLHLFLFSLLYFSNNARSNHTI